MTETSFAFLTRIIVRFLPERWLISWSRWSPSDGEPMNLEACELCRRWFSPERDKQ
ncbi:hypothetical protein FHX61_005377 [Cupriavidus alkaliphilus]|uniref:Uncharacterized protein n=1 Tax=Cupriavidus alkaliphilus TaxID=942866 RepID=A0A7W4YUV2_9BURK|nr:hypothetical protein [Cupriavidus alkaliphilus]